MRLEFEALHIDTEVTARGLERFRLAPWGLAGGKAGTTGRCTVTRGGEPVDAGKFDLLRLGPGERVDIVSAAGAGYGDPFDRPVAEVLADVRRGLLTERYAVDRYGVVVSEGQVDEVATEERRGAHSPQPAELDLGAERHALAQRWPDEVQAQVRDLVAGLPTHVRDWAKHEVYRGYQDGGDVVALCDAVRKRLGRSEERVR